MLLQYMTLLRIGYNVLLGRRVSNVLVRYVTESFSVAKATSRLTNRASTNRHVDAVEDPYVYNMASLSQLASPSWRNDQQVA